ncbi:carbon-nitrogen hydrolase family protein [Bifidobacterium pseudocatenulatum]|jgi:deaminated glutathione amidase|uniref:carbon-nitrogen hydrolase family protein n=2 Tax=Bifidobacterium pseudocatenulatum TaxID=28026 RepID=UPI00286ED910|nr:carbon-nitrogen hydrolase family protein [Bifidobacterium pseudocatenulatum]
MMENRKTCANPIEKQEVLDTFADESAVSTKTQQCRYKGTNAKHESGSRAVHRNGKAGAQHQHHQWVHQRAARNHARILLLPEGLIARSDDDPRYTADHAQTIDGPFVTALRGISEANNLAIMGTVHLHEDTADLPYNCFLVIDHGRILLEYRKIHLYNAFGERESDSIAPGHEIPPLVDIDGWKFGVMTCYDIRFLELARRHAVAGADVLVVSAAWARGEGKVDHWTTLCKARALENTCYLMACSEHSGHDIGHSMVVDPAARILAQSGERDELIYTDLNRNQLEDVRRILPVLKNRRITL